MTDCHCHLADPHWGSDLSQRLEEARRHGVHRWFSCAYDIASWSRQVELSSWPGVRIALGLHPWVAESWQPDTGALLEQTLLSSQAVAIGECGLDFSRSRDTATRELQIRVLREQLLIARRLGVPVVLHCVRAQQALLQELDDFRDVRVMVHGFLGSSADAQTWIRRGAYLSLGPHAQSREDLMRVLPLDRVLIETDAPSRGSSLLDLIQVRRAWEQLQPLQEDHFEQNLRRFLGLQRSR